MEPAAVDTDSVFERLDGVCGGGVVLCLRWTELGAGGPCHQQFTSHPPENLTVGSMKVQSASYILSSIKPAAAVQAYWPVRHANTIMPAVLGMCRVRYLAECLVDEHNNMLRQHSPILA